LLKSRSTSPSFGLYFMAWDGTFFTYPSFPRFRSSRNSSARCISVLHQVIAALRFCFDVFSTGPLIGLHFKFGAVVMELLCGALPPRRLVGKNCDARGRQARVVGILLRSITSNSNQAGTIEKGGGGMKYWTCGPAGSPTPRVSPMARKPNY
jgi:hypothetical protein